MVCHGLVSDHANGMNNPVGICIEFFTPTRQARKAVLSMRLKDLLFIFVGVSQRCKTRFAIREFPKFPEICDAKIPPYDQKAPKRCDREDGSGSGRPGVLPLLSVGA